MLNTHYVKMLLCWLLRLPFMLIGLDFALSSPLTNNADRAKGFSFVEESPQLQSRGSALAVQARSTPHKPILINGYELKMLGYTAVLPVEIVAAFMQELWTDVVRAANLRLQQGFHDDFLEVSLGLMVASFQSLDGSLDWRTIIAFAARLTNEVSKGQSCLWRVALCNSATNAVIGVLLTVPGADSIPPQYHE